jgi:hypothetical protein
MAIKDNSLFAVACQHGDFQMVQVLGPYVKLKIVQTLPISETQCPASSCQAFSAGRDTTSSVLMNFCICAMQKENLPLVQYFFSSASPIINHATMWDCLTVIDRLLVLSTGSKTTMTAFSASLIPLLVSLVLDGSGTVEEKVSCSVDNGLPRIRALLGSYMIHQFLTMIGQIECYSLPTEIRQLIAFFALLI